tara:strand:- start:1196 stop:1822 length:627 start_codon:yes stop_codon:yes gene_type:complete
MVAPAAAVAAKTAADNPQTTALVVGGLALFAFWQFNKTIGTLKDAGGAVVDAGGAVVDAGEAVVDVVVDAGEAVIGATSTAGESVFDFTAGVFTGTDEKKYVLSTNQMGSPNPPDAAWFKYFTEEDFDDTNSFNSGAGTIPVQDGLKQPTAAVYDVITPSGSSEAGGAVFDRVTGSVTGLYTKPLIDIGPVELPSVQDVGGFFKRLFN